MSNLTSWPSSLACRHFSAFTTRRAPCIRADRFHARAPTRNASRATAPQPPPEAPHQRRSMSPDSAAVSGPLRSARTTGASPPFAKMGCAVASRRSRWPTTRRAGSPASPSPAPRNRRALCCTQPAVRVGSFSPRGWPRGWAAGPTSAGTRRCGASRRRSGRASPPSGSWWRRSPEGSHRSSAGSCTESESGSSAA